MDESNPQMEGTSIIATDDPTEKVVEDNTANLATNTGNVPDDLSETIFTPEPQETLMPEQQQAEREAIFTYLTNERGVKQFVHFTPESNLQSILERGILPRSEIKNQHIDAVTPDPNRLDFQLDYTSFSVSFPNYLIFFNKRSNMPDIPFVILCIDPRIILNLPLKDISYLPDNAASRSINNVLHFTGIEAAKGLFSDRATVRGITHKRDELLLPINFPTNPQAEVFLRGTIPIEYITGIHTENSEQNENVRAILPQSLAKRINIYTKSNLYLPRIDHRFWPKPVQTENGV